MPDPSAAPAALGPEGLPPPTRLSQSGTIAGTLASTRDPYQNEATPAKQSRRREQQLESAEKRRAANRSHFGGADLAEAMQEARESHDAEMVSINADRPLYLQELETQLRQNAVPPVTQIVVSDMEVAPADEDI